MNISGAHVNPALSLSLAIIGKFQKKLLLGYIFFQLLGSLLASIILYYLIGNEGKMGANLPNFEIGISPLTAVIIEFIITLILAIVICETTNDKSNFYPFCGIIIGITVGIGVMLFGPIAGGCMNPARAFGPHLLSGDFKYYWIYILGPSLGMIAGCYIYRISHSLLNVEKKE